MQVNLPYMESMGLKGIVIRDSGGILMFLLPDSVGNYTSSVGNNGILDEHVLFKRDIFGGGVLGVQEKSGNE